MKITFLMYFFKQELEEYRVEGWVPLLNALSEIFVVYPLFSLFTYKLDA